MANVYIKSLINTFLKACIFCFFIAVDFSVIFLDARNVRSTDFGEDGFVEWSQEIQLMITFLVLAYAIRKHKPAQPAVIFMTGCIAMGTIREYNNFLSDDVFHGAWTTFVLIAAAIAFYFLYKARKDIPASFHHFSRTPAYGIVLAGFIVTFVFSRVMGIPDLWHFILGNNYIRDAERAAEESIELVGYTMIGFGCIDYALNLQKEVNSEVKI